MKNHQREQFAHTFVRAFAVTLALVALLMIAYVTIPKAHAQQLNVAVVPVFSGTSENSHILKAAPGNLYKLEITNNTATAGFAMLVNLTAVPSTGAITPVLCKAIPANGSVVFDYTPTPSAQFSVGMVALLSSGANCFTYTTGTITGFFAAQVQ